MQVTVATADAAFGPAAIAALHTGSPLIALDPQLPFRARDPRADRLAARLEELAAEHAGAATEMILSSDHPAQVDRVIEAIGATVSRRSDLRALLKADVEDAFSGIVLNSVNARAGEALLCTAVYDRRMGEFIVDLPQLTEVEVSVRVFQGKEQVHLMPYSPGATHRIPVPGEGPAPAPRPCPRDPGRGSRSLHHRDGPRPLSGPAARTKGQLAQAARSGSSGSANSMSSAPDAA